MRRILLILFPFLITVALADDLPWMGVSLKAAEASRSEDAPLPGGVGFEVSHTVFGGPAAAAGTRAGDLWWKIDGQILINKGQMLVLLRSKKRGEKIGVDFYRDGELRHLEIVLGSRGQRHLTPVSFRDEDGKREARILARREKVARVRVEGRDLSLESEGKQWRFKIKKDGVQVLSALVSDDEMDERIPVKWHHSFMILRMSLERATSSPGEPGRKRVRYLPREKSPVE